MTAKWACAAAVLALAACNSGGDASSSTVAQAPAATAPTASSDATASAGGVSMPRQRVGLWRMAMTVAPGVPPISQEVCVTEQMAADAAAMTRPGATSGADCDAPQIRREGDATVSTITCRMNGRATTTHMRVTGDMQSRYHMEMTSDGSGPGATMQADATYVGPCNG